LAELTALAQIPWLDLRGPTSKGERGGGTGRKDKGREDGRRWDLLLRRGEGVEGEKERGGFAPKPKTKLLPWWCILNA